MCIYSNNRNQNMGGSKIIQQCLFCMRYIHANWMPVIVAQRVMSDTRFYKMLYHFVIIIYVSIHIYLLSYLSPLTCISYTDNVLYVYFAIELLLDYLVFKTGHLKWEMVFIFTRMRAYIFIQYNSIFIVFTHLKKKFSIIKLIG